MTAVGLPLDHDDVSKIESGKRRLTIDELFALPYVLGVPFWQLVAPEDQEPPIRAGGIGLERHEVANWMVWGPWWTRDAMSAQTFMGLTRQIQTMWQVVEDERDPEKKKEHLQTIVRLVKELWQASGIRPGVMERHAVRDQMAGREVDD